MSKLSETTSENLAARDLTRPALLSPEFSLEQRRTLLRIAHESILSALDGQPLPGMPPFPAGLAEPRGVFTTLYLGSDPPVNDLPGHDLPGNAPRHLHRQLRGC